MKLLMILCFGFVIPIQAQYTPIADVEFEQFLIDAAIDSEATLDGQVLTSDLASVATLDISFTNIADLSGIRDFTALTSLKTSQADLTSLNVSGLTNLQELDLSMSTNLNTLVLTGCTGLVDLDIRFTGLNTLDLSTCTSLSTIDLYRSFNLQELDVNGMTSITSIHANESSLNTLNVAGCTSLSSLQIDETSISSLDLRNNSALVSLNIFDAGIQTINLSNCVNFESISLTQCYAISAIQHMNTTNLKSIYFNQIGSQINNIDLSSYTNLESLFLDGTTITELDITANPNLTSFSVYGANLGTIDLRNGNNVNINSFNLFDFTSEDSGCISVDDAVYSTTNWINISNNLFFDEDCETLSTDTFSTQDIVLYPNPSHDFVMLSGLTQNTNYQIYSVEGKQINKGLLSPNEPIAISHLSPGIYFLNVDQRTTLKFVKN